MNRSWFVKAYVLLKIMDLLWNIVVMVDHNLQN